MKKKKRLRPKKSSGDARNGLRASYANPTPKKSKGKQSAPETGQARKQRRLRRERISRSQQRRSADIVASATADFLQQHWHTISFLHANTILRQLYERTYQMLEGAYQTEVLSPELQAIELQHTLTYAGIDTGALQQRMQIPIERTRVAKALQQWTEFIADFYDEGGTDAMLNTLREHPLKMQTVVEFVRTTTQHTHTKNTFTEHHTNTHH